MSKYEITPLNSNKTILQIVKDIEKYLHDNQIYKIFGYNGNYDAETELYDIDDLYTEEQLKADDVVLFNNCYVGIVDAVGTNSFSVKDVINYRGEKGDTGATGEKGEKGDKGDTGETGATGQTGATGNGIASIVKTGTSGLVDTYTITFTDGSTFTYNVTNGQNGQTTLYLHTCVPSVDTRATFYLVTTDNTNLYNQGYINGYITNGKAIDVKIRLANKKLYSIFAYQEAVGYTPRLFYIDENKAIQEYQTAQSYNYTDTITQL